MAKRPIFLPSSSKGCTDWVEEIQIEFQWHPGFSISQKQRNIGPLHESARLMGVKDVLEVSSRSKDDLGKLLSAFRLTVEVPNAGRSPLECAFKEAKSSLTTAPVTICTVSHLEKQKLQ